MVGIVFIAVLSMFNDIAMTAKYQEDYNLIFSGQPLGTMQAFLPAQGRSNCGIDFAQRRDSMARST